MKITNIKTFDIKIYARNSKHHDEAQIIKLKRAIKKFGFSVPIIVDEDYVVIAGHGRLEAAKELKMTEIPCVVKTGLSESDKKAMRIADNKIAETKMYKSVLKSEMLELNEDNYELLETGFDEDELNALLKDDDILLDDDSTKVDKLGSILITCPHCKEKFSKKEANTGGK